MVRNESNVKILLPLATEVRDRQTADKVTLCDCLYVYRPSVATVRSTEEYATNDSEIVCDTDTHRACAVRAAQRAGAACAPPEARTPEPVRGSAGARACERCVLTYWLLHLTQ